MVDAHAEMIGALEIRDTPNFRLKYGTWLGSPPTILDEHPNAEAHALIAELIA